MFSDDNMNPHMDVPSLFAIRQSEYDPEKHDLPVAMPTYATQEFKRGMVVQLWHDTNRWVFRPFTDAQVGTAYMGLLFENVDPYKSARVLARGTIVGDGASEGDPAIHNPLIWVSEKVKRP
jgi:hypothetical protein